MYSNIAAHSGLLTSFLYGGTYSVCPPRHTPYMPKPEVWNPFCFRKQNVTVDATLLGHLLVELLASREKCLSEGLGALPVPNLSLLEAEIFSGDAVPTRNHYQHDSPLNNSW